MFKNSLLFCFLMSLSIVSIADQKGVVSFHGQEPSADDLVDAFMGAGTEPLELPEGLLPAANSQTGKVNYRGIRLQQVKPDSTSQQKKAVQQLSSDQAANGCLASSQSVAVNIRFRSNSSLVKPQDNVLLAKIAKAMNSTQLKNCYFVVEGHTDAVGEEYYNLWLSQQRAASVKKFLQKKNVAAKRMIVVGKGEVELLNVQDPAAAENRRVQFKVINSVQ